MRISGGRGDGNEHVLDQLSAYLDYELPDAERTRVRDHLRRCPACENELATLRATKQLLTEVPLQSLPRSFVLTPDMVGRAMSGPVERRRSFGWTLAGRLRTATALVAVLLVLVLSSDFLNHSVLGGSAATARPPMTTSRAVGPGVDAFTTEATSTTAAQAEATSTTAPVAMAAAAATSTTAPAPAASGAAPSAESPPLESAPTVAAAAMPPEGPSVAGSANDTTTASLIAAPTASPLGYSTASNGLLASPDPNTKSVEPGSEPGVSGWQLTEGALLVLALVLGIGALWARGRGV